MFTTVSPVVVRSRRTTAEPMKPKPPVMRKVKARRLLSNQRRA